jgi:hypothetical protein
MSVAHVGASILSPVTPSVDLPSKQFIMEQYMKSNLSNPPVISYGGVSDFWSKFPLEFKQYRLVIVDRPG